MLLVADSVPMLLFSTRTIPVLSNRTLNINGSENHTARQRCLQVGVVVQEMIGIAVPFGQWGLIEKWDPHALNENRVGLVNREAVGTQALLTRLLFGGGTLCRLLSPVSPVTSTSAALPC
jgi:hypothetical protein